jgi:hypothetical protein
MEGSEPAEMVAPGAVEAGPRSSATAEAAVDVTMGEAPVHGAERAGADMTMEEVASASGQEAALASGSPSQQDPLAEPAGTVEDGAVEPLTEALEEEVLAPGAPTVEAWVPEPSSVEALAPEVPAVEGPVPLRGRAPTTVDLTPDDTPLDKGKQVMGVEGGKFADQAAASTAVGEVETAGEAGPSMGPADALAGSSSSWPDIVALAIARAEAEISRWGGASL